MKSKTSDRRGFTLAEMLVVIAILVIILAIAVPNFIPFKKRIQLMELDDSARSIFMAAQSKLTAMYSVGADLTFEDRAVKIDSVPSIYAPAPSGDVPEDEEKTVDADMRYLKYIGGVSSEADNIFSGYTDFTNVSSIEGQIYNGNYIIEYDAQTGFVYGVFYAEGDGASEIENYDPESIKRDFESRLDTMVGFYGGGTLEEKYTAGAITTEPTLEWYDLEKLMLYIRYPEGELGKKDKVYFSVTMQALDDTKTNVVSGSKEVVIVPKIDDPNYAYYITKNGGYATIILDSIAPGQGTDDGQWNLPDNRNFSEPIGAHSAENKKLGRGYVLERDFKGWTYIGNNGKTGYENDTLPATSKSSMWATGTYPTDKSGYAINPGTNFRVTVNFYDPTDFEMRETTTIDLNSYFDCKNTYLTTKTAAISAGRHLQNLANYVDGDIINSAELFSSIDFSTDLSGTKDCYKAWNSRETYKGNADNPYLYDFKPVGSQFVDESKFLNSFNGHYSDEGYMIKYVRINADPDIHPEYKPNSSSFDIFNYTGFFAHLNNSSGVKDICFYCPVVKGYGEYTGLFYGFNKNGSNFSSMTVINPIIEGPGYVGGYAGAQTGGGDLRYWKMYVEKVDDYFDNYNYDYNNNNVDGAAATKVIDWDDPTDDPYQHFVIRGTKDYKTGKGTVAAVDASKTNVPLIGDYSPSLDYVPFVGSLVGYTGDKLQESYASVRVESVGYAGGLVGYMAGGGFNQCYVGGHTYNGKFIGTADRDGYNYALINIYGKKGAGGLVGYCKNATPELGSTGIYTTCSVGSDPSNIKNADTVFGLTSDVNNRDYGEKTGRRTYSAGYIISAKYDETSKAFSDSIIVEYRSLSDNILSIGDGDKDVNISEERWVTASKYDEVLGDKYPYINTLGIHIGDWPMDTRTGILYWETPTGIYDDNTIYIKAISYDVLTGEKAEFSNLDENTSGGVGKYGYAYFYGSAIDANTDMMSGIGNNLSENLTKQIKKVLSKNEGFGSALNVGGCICFDGNNQIKTHGLQELAFNYSFKVHSPDHKLKDVIGPIVYQYNPDFCGLDYSEESGGKMLGGKDRPYDVRCVAQFNNLANSTDDNFFEQVFDFTLDQQHTPVGSLGAPFKGSYDGNSHKITLQQSMKTDNITAIGLFGCTRNANIHNLNVVYNQTLSPNNLNGKIGIGGLVGVAIGGVIEKCTVQYTVSVSAQNVNEISIGGIAGYSSATIKNCDYNAGSITCTNSSSNALVAIGGIAGSASGEISGCNSLPSELKVSNNSYSRDSLALVGGVVGNNVSYEGKIELTVKDCKVDTHFEPWSGDPLGNMFTLIHPFAPDKLQAEFVNKTADNWPHVDFLTGTGVSSGSGISSITSGDSSVHLPVAITGCTVTKGQNYYPSDNNGEQFNYGSNSIVANGDITEDYYKREINISNDVLTSELWLQALSKRIAVKALEAPAAGIYCLYEKTSGKNNAECLAATAFDDGSGQATLTVRYEDNLDPMFKYGVLIELGKFDDGGVKVKVDGNDVSSSFVSTSYKVLDSNGVVTNNGKYFDFLNVLDLSEGTHNIMVTYEYPSESGMTGEHTILQTTVTVSKKPPYAGVYNLMDDNSLSGKYVYYRDGKMQEKSMIGGGKPTDEFGIMIESSPFEKKPISEFKVMIKRNDADLSGSATLIPLGLAKYGNDSYRANGKYFDFYRLDGDWYDKIAEGDEFTASVYYGGDRIVSHTFQKPIKVPYLGVYAEFKRNADNSTDKMLSFVMRKNTLEGDKAVVRKNDGYCKDFVGYGIILEDAFKLERITVTLGDTEISGGDLKAETGQNILRADNCGNLNPYDGKNLKIYRIPDDKIPYHADEITVTYRGDKTSYSVSAKIIDDLGCKLRHNISSSWAHDETSHWHKCLVDGCTEAFDKSEHSCEWVVDKDPTKDENGHKNYICTVCKEIIKEEDIEPILPGKYGPVGLGMVYATDNWSKKYVNANFNGTIIGHTDSNKTNEFVLVLDNYNPFESYSFVFIDKWNNRQTQPLVLLDQYENTEDFEGYSIYKVDNFQYNYTYHDSIEVYVDEELIGTYKISDWYQI